MTNTVTEKEHATLGPSGWDRWSTCPGSVPLSEGRPNKASVYAAWGTVAHEIADKVLSDNASPHAFIGQTFTVDGHDIEVDEEMAECVDDYVGVVYSFIQPENGDVLMSEVAVPIGHLTGETGAEGTSDAIGIVNGGTRLVVIDLKTGKGVPVSAEGNGQGRMYAAGALAKFGDFYEDIEEIEIVISQPRLDSVSTEIIRIEELREFEQEVVLAAGRVDQAKMDAINNHETLLQPGTDFASIFLSPSEKGCKFCPAKAICPALRAEVSQAMAAVSSADDFDDFDDLTLPKQASSLIPAAELSSDLLAQALRSVDLIENWIKAIEAEGLQRALAGDPPPGFYLGVGKAGARKWKDAEQAEIELKKRFKVDEMYTKKVVSPTAAEKLLKSKPRVWATVVSLAGIEQPEGKPKLCREGVDKNPVYALPSPDDFDDLTVAEAEVENLFD